MNSIEYWDTRWKGIIKNLPTGGQYRFDLRQYGLDIVKKNIKSGSTIFDYASGLGIVDIQLQNEKDCKVYGCDYSKIAIDFLNDKLGIKNFRVTDEFFSIGKKYDAVLALHYLEHVINPAEMVKKFLKHSKKVIAMLPNNFNRHGEHINMQWSDWDSFKQTFKEFSVKRLDTVDDKSLYPSNLNKAFKHPIFCMR